MPERAIVRDHVASAPWHREPLGSVLPADDARGWPTTILAGRLATVVASVVLYALTVALLLVALRHIPSYAWNWEQYTARDVFALVDGRVSLRDTFFLRDGLMTDSGLLPPVALPAVAAFHLFGAGIDGLRLPAALLSALAVPLTFLLGRRVAGPGTGLVAAALVALSPAFLVYGRTGTVVGMSVPLALATALCLLAVVATRDRPLPGRVAALAGLQVGLLLSAYAYAPVRLLWVIAVVVLLVEVVAQRDDRGWLLSALAVTAAMLPAALVLALGLGQVVGERPEWDLRHAVSSYFMAGGEQLVNLVRHPDGFGSFMVVEPGGADRWTLAWEMARANMAALLDLLADRGTRPPLTDYWNTSGQLYPRVLVPVAMIGTVALLSRPRTVEARFTLLLLLGLTVPLLATSQVHLGRLVLASPVLMVVAAIGVTWLATLAVVRVPRLVLRLLAADRRPAGPRLAGARGVVQVALALAILAAVGVEAWRADQVTPMPSQSHAPVVVGAIREQRAAGAGAVVLVLGTPADHEVEQLDVATYRLQLDDEARFIDVREGGDLDATDGRLAVWSGGLAGADEETTRRLPGGGCEAVYLISESRSEAFAPTLDDLTDRCGGDPATVLLPF